MLGYRKFKEEVEKIMEQLIEDTPYKLVYKEVKKVNEVLDSVSLQGKETTLRMSPTLYLNEEYKKYKKGVTIDVVAKHIIDVLLSEMENTELENFIKDLDLRRYKDRIIPRVVSGEKNKEFLDECIHRKHLDLAITYCFVIPFSFGKGIIALTKKMAEMIDMTEEELYKLSKENMLRLYKPQVAEMEPPLPEIPPLYVVTDQEFENGGNYLIPELFLDDFAKELGVDLIVSASRNKMIVTIWEPDIVKEYKELISSINTTLAEEEFLSNNVYHYCRETKTLVIAPEKEKSLMEKVKEIDYDDAGLLGFAISESIDCYSDTGEAVINLFERYPDNAELLEKMLIAVCGYGIDSLKEKMEESRKYYDSL